MVGCCVRGNEPSVLIKSKGFRSCVTDRHLLKEDDFPCNKICAIMKYAEILQPSRFIWNV